MTIPQVKLEGAKGRIIDAALKLAMERQWGRVSLRDIAERAEIGLVEMREHFSSKGRCWQRSRGLSTMRCWRRCQSQSLMRPNATSCLRL